MPLADPGPGGQDHTSAATVEATLTDLVDRALSLASGRTRTILGITGPPGAGKSTLTAALSQACEGRAVVVPMDGFHLSNGVLSRLGRRGRKGAWDTFDVAGYRTLLQRLRDQKEQVVYAPSFDRSTETAIAADIEVPAHVPLVITEGNYLLHDGGGWETIQGLLDETWFLQVPSEERVRRLVARRTTDGDTDAEARTWVGRVDESNATLVQPGASRADLVLTLRQDPAPSQAAPGRTP